MLFRRFVIVAMLVLLPLQWAAAQVYESSSEVANVSAALGKSRYTSVGAGHTRDSGGAICQFHEVAQPSALAEASQTLTGRLVDEAGWPVPTALNHIADGVGNDIERPKWRYRDAFAVIL